MMFIISLLTIILCTPGVIYSRRISIEQTQATPLPDDVGLTTLEFLQKYNYSSESHEVTTEDGHIITLHRIPSGQGDIDYTSSATTKYPILMVHGLTCSSFDWVNLGPNKSLALLLNDIGYDVWLLNTRGNRYSMKHETLNITDAKFWDYSFHEKGIYDIAMSIDYILNLTTLEKVTIIGHSEGTTASMVFAASKPQYNDKLHLMVLLAPIGYMDGVISPLPLLLLKYMDELKAIFNLLNIHGFPYSENLSKLLLTVCNLDGFPEVCSQLFQLIGGFDTVQLDLDYMMVALSDKPSGLALKQLYHYGQEIRSGYFAQYDYGTLENLIRYGNATPPSYNTADITVPVAAYYSKNDFFASTADVEKLISELPNIYEAYLIEYEYFSHIDFIFAKDARTLLYDRVIADIVKSDTLIN